MSISTLIRRMSDAGAPPEAIALAVEEIEAVKTAARDDPRLVADRERSAAYRARRQLSESEWRNLRAKVFERDDFACQYCGVTNVPMSCDHVIPLVQGGSHDLDNLKTACVPCNSKKGGRTLEEWKA